MCSRRGTDFIVRERSSHNFPETFAPKNQSRDRKRLLFIVIIVKKILYLYFLFLNCFVSYANIW